MVFAVVSVSFMAEVVFVVMKLIIVVSVVSAGVVVFD